MTSYNIFTLIIQFASAFLAFFMNIVLCISFSLCVLVLVSLHMVAEGVYVCVYAVITESEKVCFR